MLCFNSQRSLARARAASSFQYGAASTSQLQDGPRAEEERDEAPPDYDQPVSVGRVLRLEGGGGGAAEEQEGGGGGDGGAGEEEGLGAVVDGGLRVVVVDCGGGGWVGVAGVGVDQKRGGQIVLCGSVWQSEA